MRYARANADDIGIFAIGIAALLHLDGRLGIQHAVPQVARFGGHAFFVQVNQDQLVAQGLVQHGEGIADADRAGADDDDFAAGFVVMVRRHLLLLMCVDEK